MLSFATRHLSCQGGIVITASHNPKIYNGYKVYDEFGGQVTDEKAGLIINEVNSIENYEDIKTISLEEAIKDNLLEYIGEDVDKAYLEEVKGLTIRTELVKEHAKDLKVIYTPIHGSGNMPVRRVLKELGYENVEVVKEQEKPDGNFPTASYPNPENPQVFELALEMAKTNTPDIIFGTDPDCDRIGVVVKENSGEYKVLTGNQTGLLLTDYILSSLKEEGKLPSNGVVIKTIVTSEGARAIANYYGVEIMDVLTGFKYIGEKIRQFQEKGDKKYLFGFEESYGYLAGEFVRDKDAVIASMLIAEMTLYYKEQGKSLYETALTEVDGVKVATRLDYKLSKEENLESNTEFVINLPKSNVLKYILADGSSFVVRPSGTEPKMKVYSAVKGESLTNAEEKLKRFNEKVMEIINEKLA